IAGNVDLDRDAAVANVCLQLRILMEPSSVPYAIGVAAMQCVGNGFGPRGLAGVNGDAQQPLRRTIESGAVPRRRAPRLRTRQIEADDAASSPSHRRLGGFKRHLRLPLAQGAADELGADTEVPF